AAASGAGLLADRDGRRVALVADHLGHERGVAAARGADRGHGDTAAGRRTKGGPGRVRPRADAGRRAGPPPPPAVERLGRGRVEVRARRASGRPVAAGPARSRARRTGLTWQTVA